MTLPPERLGDKGQRYEIRCTGYPEPGENIIGWSHSRDGAEGMEAAILRAPNAGNVRIIDRLHLFYAERCANYDRDSMTCSICGIPDLDYSPPSANQRPVCGKAMALEYYPKRCKLCMKSPVTVLDGDDLCQEYADQWVKGEQDAT